MKDKTTDKGIIPDKAGNDLKWFMNDNLIQSVTLPQFLGRKNTSLNAINYNNGHQYGIPGVVALPVKLTLGLGDQDVFHTAMQKLFINLRRANTGAQQYDVVDLEKYIYNLSIAIAVDRFLRRAYGVLKSYDSLDSLKPMSYFKAMGLDYDTFKDNAANLRYFLNQNSLRLHSILAGKADIFERRAWMFDHIFKDGKTDKSQDIMFVLTPDLNYFSYINDTFDTFTINDLSNTTTRTGYIYSSVITAVNNFMYDITSGTKVPLIAADLIKAYGLGQADTYFNEIPENYQVSPVYNEEVLCEIQNAKITTFPGPTVTPGFDTGTGLIKELVAINGVPNTASNVQGFDNYAKSAYINFYKNSINVAEYAGATRLSWYGEFDANSNLIFKHYGTEIVGSINFIICDDANIYKYHLEVLDYSALLPISLTSDANILRIMNFRGLWAMFDWLPLMTYLVTSRYDNTGTLVVTDASAGYPLLDLDNYAVLDSKLQFSNIHSAVILSLYYWPNVIKDQRVISINK